MRGREHTMEQNQTPMSEFTKIRLEKLIQLQEKGRDPFVNEKFDYTHHSVDIIDKFEELEEKDVSIAGRIMLIRGHGKASFLTIQDSEGRIQVYVRQDVVGEESYTDFKTYDIGDIIGVTGTVFRTHKGEITVKAKEVTLLTKSLHPLPDKHAGLKDPDLRYRQRYVDLIVNPEVKESFIKRSKAIKALKEYLDNRGFLEVDTPILSTIAGGANARPFETIDCRWI